MAVSMFCNQPVIQPQGRLNADTSYALQQQIIAALQTAPNLCVIDLAGVESVDSSGVLSLIAAYKAASAQRCRLLLCNLQPLVRLVFEISRLDQVFDIMQDTQVQDAYSAIATTIPQSYAYSASKQRELAAA